MVTKFCYAQDEVPAAEELDLSSMPVEDSYDGPMMEGDELYEMPYPLALAALGCPRVGLE